MRCVGHEVVVCEGPEKDLKGWVCIWLRLGGHDDMQVVMLVRQKESIEHDVHAHRAAGPDVEDIAHGTLYIVEERLADSEGIIERISDVACGSRPKGSTFGGLVAFDVAKCVGTDQITKQWLRRLRGLHSYCQFALSVAIAFVISIEMGCGLLWNGQPLPMPQ